MPDLYLAWRGSSSLNLDSTWGTRCSTALPNFDQPQTSLMSQDPGLIISGISLIALSDRILCLCNVHDSEGIIIGLLSSTSLCSAFCMSWPSFVPIGPQNGYFPESASLWPPALANWGRGALAAWCGINGYTRIWCGHYNQADNVWSSQYLTALSNSGKPIQTGAGPALVSFNGMLLMVWLGEGSNDGLYYATSRDGRTWAGNEAIPGAGSSASPALVIFNGAPVLCFKGISGDSGIYSTTYHAGSDSWAPVTNTGPFGTTANPALAVYQGKLFMCWKGAGNDTDLYWSVTDDNLNPNAWSGQANISNVGTQAGPAAVVY